MSSLDLAIPWFASRSIRRSLAWYRERLGFEIREASAEFGIAARDRVLINFWWCEDPHIPANTSAYFNVTDVDGLYAEWRSRHGGTRMTEPRTFDYGMREFHVWDLDGNLLRLGEADD